jgi:cell division protease FtsH
MDVEKKLELDDTGEMRRAWMEPEKALLKAQWDNTLKPIENTFDCSTSIFNDLRDITPRVAEILGCEPYELVAMDPTRFVRSYMFTKHRDRCIGKEGGLPNSPFIIYDRQHTKKNFQGYGLLTFQCRRATDIRYCVYSIPTQFGHDEYILIHKNSVFRYMRECHRSNRITSTNFKPPVLDEGKLEEIVNNTVGFLIRAKKISAYGCRIKRGLLMDGPPGNGKTMACRYIQRLCTQRGIRWGVITASQIDKAYGEGTLDHLFNKYSVSFFDDIDISYLNRKSGNGRMACSLLTAMDGMTNSSHLVRIFTTNEKVDDLDPAFVRPGRIDKVISLGLPTADLREKLARKVWPKSITNNIDIDELVRRTDNMSFAEMEAVRTFLVTNYVMGDGTWDLDTALDELDNRKSDEKETVTLGFGAVAPKKKKKKSYAQYPMPSLDIDYSENNEDPGMSDSEE